MNNKKIWNQFLVSQLCIIRLFKHFSFNKLLLNVFSTRIWRGKRIATETKVFLDIVANSKF